MSASDLADLRIELAYEQRRLDQQERSPYDGRMADRGELLLSMLRRRTRIALLEWQIARLEKAA